MESSAAPSPYLSLPAVLRALRAELGAWHLRGMLSHLVMMLLYRRLGQITTKIERLVARFQAGRLLVRASGVRAGDRAAAKTGARMWPGRFGWLMRAAGYQAAGYGCQLRVILEQPDMVELLKASPQAARILRPVCRMLAIETSMLRPGVVVPEPVVRPRKPRVRKPRIPIDFGRIPLPRGVLSAARRQGFGRDNGE
ncbi:MAG: hypothetical protein P4L66_03935 [Acetobacteraceae bacterium]|nr:hypothetical protein [Acetobacteraceae bacterium]